MTEWRPLPELGTTHLVSSDGRALVLPHRVLRSNGITQAVRGGPLTVTFGPNGYGTVRIHRVTRYVHELMALAFLGPRPRGQYARHLDDVRSHNVVENIEWGTPGQNALDKVRNGHDLNASKTHCNRGHLLACPNLGASAMKLGRRQCKACIRATAWANGRPTYPTEQQIAERADWQYNRIMEAAA